MKTKNREVSYKIPSYLIPYLEVIGRIEHKELNTVINEQFFQMVRGYHPKFFLSIDRGKPLIYDEGSRTLKLKGEKTTGTKTGSKS
jgi:hypothetical protein